MLNKREKNNLKRILLLIGVSSVMMLIASIGLFFVASDIQMHVSPKIEEPVIDYPKNETANLSLYILKLITKWYQ
jgi:hypothetical protein